MILYPAIDLKDGKAVRLLRGDMDKATLSTPYRYSFCFSENEDQSPWEPRHGELGYKPEASTVTIAAILGVYNVMESTVGTGIEVLRTITANMRGVGIPGYYHLGTRPQIVLVLCPEHANEIAGSGMSKADVREYIYANARMPIHQLKDLAHYGNRVWPNWINQTNPNTLVPICASPDDIVVVVAGGGGRHHRPGRLKGRLGTRAHCSGRRCRRHDRRRPRRARLPLRGPSRHRPARAPGQYRDARRDGQEPQR